ITVAGTPMLSNRVLRVWPGCTRRICQLSPGVSLCRSSDSGGNGSASVEWAEGNGGAMALEKPGAEVAAGAPTVANRLAWIPWRRRQCQRGVGGRERSVDGVGGAGDDGRGQGANGGEQAGVDPVAAGPAFVERGRQVVFQLPMQGGVVQDVQTLFEALFACGA